MQPVDPKRLEELRKEKTVVIIKPDAVVRGGIRRLDADRRAGYNSG